MTPERQILWLRVAAVAGAVLFTASHSTVIPEVYARALGELSGIISAGAAAWASLSKPGDVDFASLPAEYKDSVRPPK
jgi:hypothetical protein